MRTLNIEIINLPQSLLEKEGEVLPLLRGD
jgi:hypothetical protein